MGNWKDYEIISGFQCGNEKYYTFWTPGGVSVSNKKEHKKLWSRANMDKLIHRKVKKLLF